MLFTKVTGPALRSPLIVKGPFARILTLQDKFALERKVNFGRFANYDVWLFGPRWLRPLAPIFLKVISPRVEPF